jgi:hypothetical protein
MKPTDYRLLALKMYPWVCGKCGRDFNAKNLAELTVHHKDHNHNNNPLDGSNWELLCVYCHDNEHSRNIDAQWTSSQTTKKTSPSLHNPFDNLKTILEEAKPKKK